MRTGITLTSGNGPTIAATQFTLHPEYDKETHQYDIGIVTLDTPLKLDGIKQKTVLLASEGTYVRPGDEVTVTGWGFTLVSSIAFYKINLNSSEKTRCLFVKYFFRFK